MILQINFIQKQFLLPFPQCVSGLKDVKIIDWEQRGCQKRRTFTDKALGILKNNNYTQR